MNRDISFLTAMDLCRHQTVASWGLWGGFHSWYSPILTDTVKEGKGCLEKADKMGWCLNFGASPSPSLCLSTFTMRPKQTLCNKLANQWDTDGEKLGSWTFPLHLFLLSSKLRLCAGNCNLAKYIIVCKFYWHDVVVQMWTAPNCKAEVKHPTWNGVLCQLQKMTGRVIHFWAGRHKSMLWSKISDMKMKKRSCPFSAHEVQQMAASRGNWKRSH